VPLKVKLFLVACVVAMVAVGAYAYANGVTGERNASLTKPEFVTQFIPRSGSEVLSQSTVGIELAEGYDAYLVIGDVAVTNRSTATEPDGLRRNTSVRGVYYDPGPGRQVARLQSPEECVTAMVWRVTDGPATAAPTRWCFDVL